MSQTSVEGARKGLLQGIGRRVRAVQNQARVELGNMGDSSSHPRKVMKATVATWEAELPLVLRVLLETAQSNEAVRQVGEEITKEAELSCQDAWTRVEEALADSAVDPEVYKVERDSAESIVRSLVALGIEAELVRRRTKVKTPPG